MTRLKYTEWVHRVKKGRLWLNQEAYARLGGCRRVILTYDAAEKWVKITPSPDYSPRAQMVTVTRPYALGKDGKRYHGEGHFLKLKGNQDLAFTLMGDEAYFAYQSDGRYVMVEDKYFKGEG